MIEKSVKIDEAYHYKFEEFVKNSHGAVEIVDKNLEYDPYFYKRKKSIEETIRQVDSGEMEMIDFNTSIDKVIEKLSK
ncbi:MAG: hypothetical protein Ctma_1165 [Catillopecten margaritatus gill symbiont]|uniref:Uncharacterized protein n=1 Tax=Catillopecten margaritatus gill symbiont TaxID=3083288 RepID=A0AAU6PHC3_9GAMM